jgi:hypothetical protein
MYKSIIVKVLESSDQYNSESFSIDSRRLFSRDWIDRNNTILKRLSICNARTVKKKTNNTIRKRQK